MVGRDACCVQDAWLAAHGWTPPPDHVAESSVYGKKGRPMSADLSVVICSLNGAAGVDRCLRALAAQKDVELQIIVVDDGSTDRHERRRQGAMVLTVIRHDGERRCLCSAEHWYPGGGGPSWHSSMTTANLNQSGPGNCLSAYVSTVSSVSAVRSFQKRRRASCSAFFSAITRCFRLK